MVDVCAQIVHVAITIIDRFAAVTLCSRVVASFSICLRGISFAFDKARPHLPPLAHSRFRGTVHALVPITPASRARDRCCAVWYLHPAFVALDDVLVVRHHGLPICSVPVGTHPFVAMVVRRLVMFGVGVAFRFGESVHEEWLDFRPCQKLSCSVFPHHVVYDPRRMFLREHHSTIVLSVPCGPSHMPPTVFPPGWVACHDRLPVK